jgi:hypothetical protein
MRIEYNLPHCFEPDTSRVMNAMTLEASLDYLTRLNLIWLKAHPATVPLYRSGVCYGRTKVWEPIPALFARQYGDCKSLSAALVAEYLIQGIECRTVHRYILRPTNNSIQDYHVLVQVGDRFEDPSKRLGMPTGELKKFGL